VIGRAGGLPWHLPDDLKRFKQITTGHTIIMGRRTWESIGRRLPKRRMIVVSRQPGYSPGVTGVEAAPSLDAALRLAQEAGETEAFVIGGAELFREALPKADRLHWTTVHADVAGDAFFPDWRRDAWSIIEQVDHPPDERHEYPMTFEVLERCRPQNTSK
jgi:dihydrofolate reductase